MSRPRALGSRLRWLLLAAAILCWLAGAFYLLNLNWPQWEFLSEDPKEGAGLLGVMGWTFDDTGAPGHLATLALYLGLFFLTQYLFLSPNHLWRSAASTTPRPLKRSILIASLLAAMLSIALVATILHLLNNWTPIVFPDQENVFKNPRLWPPLLILALSWLVWSILLIRYARTLNHATFTSKLLRGLFAGSLLETLIAAPAHALVRHPDDCYCMRGSYTGLVFGITVLFWAFGPAIALLFLREKIRLARTAPLCPQCNYDLRGSIAANSTTCPECGTPIPRQAILIAHLKKGDTTHYFSHKPQ